jgi:hypothetical protein
MPISIAYLGSNIQTFFWLLMICLFTLFQVSSPLATSLQAWLFYLFILAQIEISIARELKIQPTQLNKAT